MRKIIVEPYNPVWKTEFTKAQLFYGELLSDIDVEIEHVGSTSVEGLWAKPILDIDIVVKNTKDRDIVIARLLEVGYTHQGNLGVEGREALSYEEDNRHITWMKHHLYVCMADCENLWNHLLLRKHLRANPSAVKAYSVLKSELAKKYRYDIDAYVEGKTALITQFLKAEGMDSEKLVRITEINKKK